MSVERPQALESFLAVTACGAAAANHVRTTCVRLDKSELKASFMGCRTAEAVVKNTAMPHAGRFKTDFAAAFPTGGRGCQSVVGALPSVQHDGAGPQAKRSVDVPRCKPPVPPARAPELHLRRVFVQGLGAGAAQASRLSRCDHSNIPATVHACKRAPAKQSQPVVCLCKCACAEATSAFTMQQSCSLRSSAARA